MRKITSVIASKFKRFKTYLHKRNKLWFSGGKWCRLVWWCERQKINDRLLLQAQRRWRSTKLGCQEAGHIFFSLSEAEHQGMAAAVQETLYLKQLLEEFGFHQKHPIAIGKDNQSCIKLRQSPVMRKRSKHIETKFHFIRDMTEEETISIHCVLTDKMALEISKKFYPNRRWKPSELFWWEQTLRNQLKSVWVC